MCHNDISEYTIYIVQQLHTQTLKKNVHIKKTQKEIVTKNAIILLFRRNQNSTIAIGMTELTFKKKVNR